MISIYFLFNAFQYEKILPFSAFPPTPLFIYDDGFSFTKARLYRKVNNKDRWHMLGAGLFHLAKGVILFFTAFTLGGLW